MSTPSPSLENHCESLTGPFRGLSEDIIVVLWLSFLALSIFLTTLMRRLVKGYWCENPEFPDPPQSTSRPRQRCPDCTCPNCRTGIELNPPLPHLEPQLQPSLSLEKTSVGEIKKVDISQPRSTASFILGTIVLLLDATALVLLAFTHQPLATCLPAQSSPSSYGVAAAALWFVFSPVAAYATCAAMTWAILARDYFSGPGVIYKRSIREEYGACVALAIIFGPIFVIFMLVGSLILLLTMPLCVCFRLMKKRFVHYRYGSSMEAGRDEEDPQDSIILVRNSIFVPLAAIKKASSSTVQSGTTHT